jgi:peptidoglycan/LPS O-acetylase OafA/YrhL
MTANQAVLRPAPQTRGSRLPELDGIRGMAITIVLLNHSFSAPARHVAWLQDTFAIGWSGVDLFFVLSGFLIGGILLDVKKSSNYFKAFYARRAFRILPLYYVWVGGYFLIAVFAGNPETWRSVPIYVFFLENSIRISHGPLGIVWLSHLWSLCVEEQFYLVVPLAIRFLNRSWLVPILFMTIVIATVSRVCLHLYLPSHSAAQYMLTICRADALAMGVLLAIAWRNESLKGKLCRHQGLIQGIVLLLLGAFLYLAIWNSSKLSLTMAAWGLTAVDAFFAGLITVALLFPFGAWAGICRWPFLAKMGRISFCFYLIHPTVNQLCHRVLLHETEAADNWLSIAVTVLAAPLTYYLATLSWKYFEHPLLRRGHAFTY